MPAYDGTRFDPPAPVALVRLVNPETGESVDEIPMLLDSGADVTLLPRAAVDTLNLPALDVTYTLAGFDNKQSEAGAVHAQLVLLDKRFRGTFLVIDSDVGVIGRNILNSIRIQLDGPTERWDEVVAPERLS
ncbi:MAG: hypothetical protein IPF82_11210 [Blastocatellia bacterium]|nr:hypothetical protein [Blastocatellia bacterium]